MARITINLPETFEFSTEIPVRISDVNYGGHLGNDAMLSLIHEARLRFLNHHGFTELDIDGFSIILTDVAIIYKSEGFYGDILKFEVTTGDFNKRGCDFFFRITQAKTGKLVAAAKTGIVFFNYEKRKVVNVPDKFKGIR